MSVEESYRAGGFGEVPNLSEIKSSVPEWNKGSAYNEPVANATTIKSNVLYNQYEQAESDKINQRAEAREMKNIRVIKRNQRIFAVALTLAIGVGIYGGISAENRRVDIIKQHYPTIESLVTAYYTPNDNLNSEDRAVIEQVLEIEHGVTVEEAIQMTFPGNQSR